MIPFALKGIENDFAQDLLEGPSPSGDHELIVKGAICWRECGHRQAGYGQAPAIINDILIVYSLPSMAIRGGLALRLLRLPRRARPRCGMMSLPWAQFLSFIKMYRVMSLIFAEARRTAEIPHNGAKIEGSFGLFWRGRRRMNASPNTEGNLFRLERSREYIDQGWPAREDRSSPRSSPAEKPIGLRELSEALTTVGNDGRGGQSAPDPALGGQDR
ncbi:hypothetical protein [Bradyrhizobium australiense]|uniref:Uncharacterized protein n=1 Tax=Bradyrhizobium australiense TaxID=2721161 RepID=A0A7Y4GYZ6_9BRAD|nr:hypothetical protein [Bradyrhizobium australiense]NOJ44601.1 hypothetical protein [Bradyrhizobium australiense]